VTIQIVLTCMLFGVALLVAIQRVTSGLFRVSILAIVAVGLFLVWSPEMANRASRALGIGRGADLVLYLWLVVSLGLVALLYLKIVALTRTITQLARAMALKSPISPANPEGEN
jgi:hypothetical protein